MQTHTTEKTHKNKINKAKQSHFCFTQVNEICKEKRWLRDTILWQAASPEVNAAERCDRFLFGWDFFPTDRPSQALNAARESRQFQNKQRSVVPMAFNNRTTNLSCWSLTE